MSHDLTSVVYDIALYGKRVADIGDGGKEVEGVSAVSVIAKDSGASKNGDSSEVREKPRDVGDGSRKEAKIEC